MSFLSLAMAICSVSCLIQQLIKKIIITGPNGAGKTSSINMLIGFSRPTQGDGWVEGFSIVTSMHKIYSIMGVCPQNDVVWETLTPREHLTFYATLKNLYGLELQNAITDSLKSVNLLDVIDSRASTFSGGMKRRLSAAISLIGKPLVVQILKLPYIYNFVTCVYI